MKVKKGWQAGRLGSLKAKTPADSSELKGQKVRRCEGGKVGTAGTPVDYVH
jgi:hypothetical protein